MAEIARRFRLPKTTGTHADVLLATGLADLLASLDVGEVRLRDRGADFEVEPARPVGDDDVDGASLGPGYPFVVVDSKTRPPRGATDVVDYRAEKEKFDRWRKAREAARKAGTEVAADIAAERPRPDWRLLQVLNTMQGDGPWNRVHETILTSKPGEMQKQIAAALRAVSVGQRSGLDWKGTLVQLFTPSAAKGYARLKPDGTERNDKTKEEWRDDFLEWLRFRGYYRTACPLFLGDDIRLLVPVPGDISLAALEAVAAEVRRDAPYGRAPRVDVLAALRLARLLIRHSEEYHDRTDEPFPGLRLVGRTPADALSGLAVTHYQSLGSARAVSAMSVLALPAWFPLHSREDATLWLEILDEHERALLSLRDDHSDEIGLILAYRRGLERRGRPAIWHLVEFLEQYGAFVLHAREEGRKPRQFDTDHLRRILMEGDEHFSVILDDPGFRTVAAAVRRSTVSAQTLKSMRKNHRQIRYDLLHELRRKRTVSGPAFIEALGDFIASYNAENARRREMNLQAPGNITTEELVSLVRLVDRWGAATVGALLCAYGTCREPRAAEEAAEPTSPEPSN